MTIFLTLFIVTVFSIIYYNYSRSTQAVLKLGNELIARSHESIIQQLDSFLRPRPFEEITKYLLNDKILDLADMQSLTSFMNIILTSYPELTNAYISDNHGNFFIESVYNPQTRSRSTIPFVEPSSIPADTKYISQSIALIDKQRWLTVVYKDKEGKIIKSEKDILVTYDPRERPWYQGAQLSRHIPWIGTYEFFPTKKFGLTFAFSIPVKTEFVGVAAADLNTKLIIEQLGKFSVNIKGSVFIVNNNDKIITQEKSTDPDGGLPTIDQLHNPLLITAYRTHQTSNKNNFTFTYNNVKYIANFTPYAISQNEKWEIATVIPADIFIGSLKTANQYTLIFSLLMLVIGIVLIVISSHKISRPIIRVAKATRDIAKLQFDRKVQIDTHIYEVQLMIDALNSLKSALSSFEKYLPKVLVEQLLETKTIAQLGGHKQELTVLFTDIENFTEITERTDPEILMLHISEYLNALTQSIHDYKGTIDKYIGDAIMAFWNAPIADEEHIVHACQSVLTCRAVLKNLNTTWQQQGKPLLHTRFGLHTGIAIVGNMGSSDRLNYTAIGDTVNISARLEALNKIYGTDIIVSDAIYAKCAKQFLFRPLDSVKVRGKQEITIIYELVAGNENSEFQPTSAEIDLCRLSTSAYTKFHDKNIAEAEKELKIILELFPQDKWARIYLQRCSHL